MNKKEILKSKINEKLKPIASKIKKMNWKLYGALVVSLVLTAFLVWTIFVIAYNTAIEVKIIWQIIAAIITFILIVLIFVIIVYKGYRTRISTRIAIILTIVSISIPTWIIISEPMFNPGRESIVMYTNSVNGNHTLSVEYILDFSSEYYDVGNITENYRNSFLQIKFIARGNVSIGFNGKINSDQLYWSGVDERINFNYGINSYIFKWNQSEFESDQFSLYIDNTVTQPSVRLRAFSFIHGVDNSPGNKVLNISHYVNIRNIYENKVNIESTNLALTHPMERDFIGVPTEQRIILTEGEYLFYNFDLDFSTRWTRFFAELNLIFLAVFIEPIIEFRAIVIECSKKLENRGLKNRQQNQNSENNSIVTNQSNGSTNSQNDDSENNSDEEEN